MSALVAFVSTHRAELATRLGEHVVLVVISTAIAAAIGIPLGIAAARRPSRARAIVAAANLAQTVPSLALIGFLIPLPLVGGIGTRTALVALTLYAVLPILRGAITGLQGVEPSVIECATALGMTRQQVLWHVEWPLALPSIMSGLRVATVVGVGTATIASAIGAGGLGDYIFRGLAMVDSTVILAGALPAAALAIAADGLLAGVAAMANPRRRTRRGVAGISTAVVAALAATAIALGSHARTADVIVGSKNFTEQVVLGELAAQALERAGLSVDRRLNLGGTSIAHEALVNGSIDLYVEYTGTALTAIFKEPVMPDGDRVFARVRERYAEQGLTLLPRLGFNNTFTILVRGDAAAREHLTRVSDLARVAPRWTAGFGYEFLERPDGFPGLSAAYGLRFAGQPRVMDLNLIYRALAAGEIDVTAGDATSGLIDTLGLAALEDDRHYFPVYDAAPVARAAFLLRQPRAFEALRALGGRVSAADVRRMNAAVDGKVQEPAAAVRAFLDMIPQD